MSTSQEYIELFINLKKDANPSLPEVDELIKVQLGCIVMEQTLEVTGSNPPSPTTPLRGRRRTSP